MIMILIYTNNSNNNNSNKDDTYVYICSLLCYWGWFLLFSAFYSWVHGSSWDFSHDPSLLAIYFRRGIRCMDTIDKDIRICKLHNTHICISMYTVCRFTWQCLGITTLLSTVLSIYLLTPPGPRSWSASGNCWWASAGGVLITAKKFALSVWPAKVMNTGDFTMNN